MKRKKLLVMGLVAAMTISIMPQNSASAAAKAPALAKKSVSVSVGAS